MCHVEPVHALALACGHHFCKECWQMHFQVQISTGVTSSKYRYCDQIQIKSCSFILSLLEAVRIDEQLFSVLFSIRMYGERLWYPSPRGLCPERRVQSKDTRQIPRIQFSRLRQGMSHAFLFIRFLLKKKMAQGEREFWCVSPSGHEPSNDQSYPLLPTRQPANNLAFAEL